LSINGLWLEIDDRKKLFRAAILQIWLSMSNNKVLPSPSTNLYERSMSALFSTFQGEFDEEDLKPSIAPKMDYIVGSFLDSLQAEKKVIKHEPINYSDNMLMDYTMPLSYYQQPTPLASPQRFMEKQYTAYDGSNHEYQFEDSYPIEYVDTHLQQMKKAELNEKSDRKHYYRPHHDIENAREPYLYSNQFINTSLNPSFIPRDAYADKKVYQCDFENCQKQYSKQNSLDIHKRSHHENIGDKSKQYACDACPQAFSRSHGILKLIRFEKTSIHTFAG
jgi:hypothetical protein